MLHMHLAISFNLHKIPDQGRKKIIPLARRTEKREKRLNDPSTLLQHSKNPNLLSLLPNANLPKNSIIKVTNCST